MKRALVLALACGWLACWTGAARAQADPDTTLRGFLENLSDSTDAYFGETAAPLDTAGLDSALAYGLAHPRTARDRGALRLEFIPNFSFNRADGPVWGGGIGIGRPGVYGHLRGMAGYAAGPNEWLGEGTYEKTKWRHEIAWAFQLRGGRTTESLEREHPDHQLATARALIYGKDRKNYYRREGFAVRLAREATTWRAAIGFRGDRELPLATTTTWNLLHQQPSVIENLAATRGRANELGYELAWRPPRLPLTIEATHFTAGDAIGSELEYRRYRVALGGNFGLGRHFSAVPQMVYGRLHMDAVPQESFFLGGSHTLRSLKGNSRGGSGIALARIDVIGVDDVLALAHIPHPEFLPIQFGTFAAIGTVWGKDPYGGPTRPGVDWPRKEAWLSEVGLTLQYQVGIPDPTTAIRFNYAFPIGPKREENRFSIALSRAFDLIRGIGQ